MITDNKNFNGNNTAILTSTDTSQLLFNHLRSEIESGILSPGDKMCPVRKLSENYNLSFEAVRKVLKRLENIELISIKQGSGTYINALAQSNKSLTSSAALLLMDGFGHVYRNISEGIINILQNRDITCVKFACDQMRPNTVSENTINALSKWEKNPPRAIVVSWIDSELFSILYNLQAAGTHIISLLGNSLAHPEWDYVGINTEVLARLACDQLVAKGYQRIGLVTHRRHIRCGDPTSHRKRKVGHTELILDMGYQLREVLNKKGSLTIFYQAASQGSIGSDPLSSENISRAMDWLTQPNRPTAVVGSDFRLVGVIKAAEALGILIPDELELLGIGNTPWSKAYGFNSIDLNEPLIAKCIANMITDDSDPDIASVNRIKVSPSLNITY